MLVEQVSCLAAALPEGSILSSRNSLGGARELQIKAGRWVASMPCRSPITGSGLELICKRQLYIWWCHGSKGLNLEVIEHLGSIFQTKLRFPSPIHVKYIYPTAIRHGLDCGRPQ